MKTPTILINMKRGDGDEVYEYLKKNLLALPSKIIKTDYSTEEIDLLIPKAKLADVIISGQEVWDEKNLEKIQGKTKLICRMGIGVDNINLTKARELDISVANTPGANANAVAEGAVSLMLALCRNISLADRQMRKGIWNNKTLTTELIGKTVGVVGYGNIGKKVISLLSGFTKKIVVFDPFITKPAKGQEYVTFTSLDNLIRQSDFISIHVPSNNQTHHLVNADFLQKMKPTAFLINTSRGSIVDEDQLIDALKERTIGGAALDVFKTEPLQNSDFLALDNIIITPHMLSASRESVFKVVDMLVDNIKVFFEGLPQNIVN
ncbi:MAG: phosphoglycerate dehydrogenase [Sphaerochaeta sp.]|nr:phosphoglycerate dehydrogenase [Sphaerochaeta sp.]